MKSTITEKNIERIDQIANDINIEWFCTPMYPEAVSFLNPFVKRFKIRELDGRVLLKDQQTPLIEAVINTDKEIFVSSEKSPEFCKYYHNSNIKRLYCVPKYPCSLDEINFKEISSAFFWFIEGLRISILESLILISISSLSIILILCIDEKISKNATPI